MKISIILPNYNHAPYLQERIDSILNQTHQNFELIILDDCSTDNSRNLLNTYKNHPKVSHIIYNDINSGNTFLQWEKGLTLASGDIIWIAESDDNMHCSFLEKAIKIFEKNKTIGIVQCGSDWVSEDGSIIFCDSLAKNIDQVNGKNFILKYMLDGNSIYNASAVLFNKDLINLPLDKSITQLKYCGDWLFWIKILEKTNLYYLNENLNSFRRHTQTVSNKSEKTGLFYLEGIKIYGYLRTKYNKHNNFYKWDYRWASKFSLKNYSFKIVIDFVISCFKINFFMPFYVVFSLFKTCIYRLIVQIHKKYSCT